MELAINDADMKIWLGDARDVSRLEPESVDTIITSPPYFLQRDYQVEGQIGQEQTASEFVESLVAVFDGARKVLKKTGVVFLNLGDTYASNWGLGAKRDSSWWSPNSGDLEGKGWKEVETKIPPNSFQTRGKGVVKVKDMFGIPWETAFALRNDGWYLRSEIIWEKPDAMPSSVVDRPTTSHEHVFMLSKRAKYYFNMDAVREPYKQDNRKKTTVQAGPHSIQHRDGERWPNPLGRAVRTVWSIPTQPLKDEHYAPFPEKLVELCISAGCPEGGTVLDLFCGSGTVPLVARKMGRKSIGIELSPVFIELIKRRTGQLSLLA